MAQRPNKAAVVKVRALYVRVSTEAQAEEGYSVGAQTERLEAYCKAMGWTDYVRYIDGGWSGSNLNRPEMQRLIADAEMGKLKSVIVYKLDRLSRSQKDTLFLIEDVFLPNGIDFISLNESIDTSTAYGRAMIGILSAFAQLERENIYMRTRMGMLERVKQGYWPGGGGIPFGYDYDREQGILVPNADAETVREIYELYIRGLSAQKIAERLGLRYEKLVDQILTRRSNLGLIDYKGVEYPGRHEPIVSEETFALAQRKRRERAVKARATPAGTHLLTGLVWCGACGSRMRYMRWGKAGYKLVCYSYDRTKAYMSRSGGRCGQEPVAAPEIEALVLGDLFRVSATAPEEGGKQGAFADPLEELERRIARTESKLKRLYNLYAEAEDETLLEAIGENRQLLDQLRVDRDAEEKSHAAAQELSALRGRLSAVSDTWEYLSGRERQALIRDCVSRIVIGDGRVEVFYTFTLEQQ